MTASASGSIPSPPIRPGTSPLMRFGVFGLGVVWVAVLVISVFSPENVSGTEQDHFPIAAILTWIWGLFASRAMVTTLVAQRDRPERLGDVRMLMYGIAAVWVAAAGFAVFGPELVTGTDPTRFPIAAVLAPIAAMVLTTSACQLFASLTGGGENGSSSGPAERAR